MKADAVDAPRQAPPLAISREIILFQSTDDVQQAVSLARFRCLAGAGLSVGGFAAFLTSVASTLPPAMFAVLLTGATLNGYLLSAVAQRVVRNLALRHVDRILVLPPPDGADSSASATTTAASPAGSAAGLAAILSSAATVEERVAATPELFLEVRTATADRWLTLVDPAESDQRASFGDLCGRLRLLHVNADRGACCDPAMLTALTNSSKVVLDERAEPRADVVEGLRNPSGTAVQLVMLSEVTRADIDEAAGAVGDTPPVQAIEQLGWRGLVGGVSVLMAGCLFVVGEGSRDPDGVARWLNLRRFGL